MCRQCLPEDPATVERDLDAAAAEGGRYERWNTTTLHSMFCCAAGERGEAVRGKALAQLRGFLAWYDGAHGRAVYAPETGIEFMFPYERIEAAIALLAENNGATADAAYAALGETRLCIGPPASAQAQSDGLLGPLWRVWRALVG